MRIIINVHILEGRVASFRHVELHNTEEELDKR